ncbi:hypothetical protein [Natrinema altunense]|uniref:DUF8071 domain-containing protein n=1 Tax=Natrinema altunense (strain JCM 12890 / CGMCC 1.3731 / AJ2) TaxID=1227494 RepID=L9ZR32_NATA2|nr:hypothetical protein [Natrinema altunense]ELY88526.1 hypothetical protein C485_06195 [Natrinema altunense JCM 12890]
MPFDGSRLRKRGRSLVSVVSPWFVGRRPAASLAVGFLAAVLALAVAAGVGTTIGSGRVADLVVETWTGAELHVEVVAATCLVVAIGAVSAAVTRGFVPTFALVASVPFGVGLARYGIEYTVGHMTAVVSLPEAFADGAGAAIVIGLPLAVVSYLVGVSVRRAADSDGGSSGPGLHPHRT